MLAEKSGAFNAPLFSYFKLSEVFRAYCFRLSDLFVSGFLGLFF